jgi:hypothetical protein
MKVAVARAFVFTFRIVACSSALLALGSAATARRLIDHKSTA